MSSRGHGTGNYKAAACLLVLIAGTVYQSAGMSALAGEYPFNPDEHHTFYYTPDDTAPDLPGAPRSQIFMRRRLVEEGYELASPLQKIGIVYFAEVVDLRHRHLCLILDAYEGTILQRFQYVPGGLAALNPHTPGPGYAGYPPYKDGRFAIGCPEYVPAPPLAGPVVIPGITAGQTLPDQPRMKIVK